MSDSVEVAEYNPETGEIIESGSVVRDAIASLSAGRSNVFSSITGTDFASKLANLSATTNSVALVDNLNKTINVKDIVIQIVQMLNEDTNRREDAPRVILIDSEGTAYHAISKGLFSSVENMIGILGQPGTWPFPIPVKAQREGSGTRKYFTLYPDMDAVSKLAAK